MHVLLFEIKLLSNAQPKIKHFTHKDINISTILIGINSAGPCWWDPWLQELKCHFSLILWPILFKKSSNEMVLLCTFSLFFYGKLSQGGLK